MNTNAARQTSQSSSSNQSLETPSVSIRLLFIAGSVVVTLPFVHQAHDLLDESYYKLGARAHWQALAMIYAPWTLMILATGARKFNIALATYWAWNLVFLGIAPAVQLSRWHFPWEGSFLGADIEKAQSLVLLGHAVFLSAALYASRGGPKKQARSTNESKAAGVIAPKNPTLERRQVRLLVVLAMTYMGVAIVFVGLMGSALYNARAVFRVRVLEIASLPLGGFLYFAVTAGAITIPAALIACRRWGVGIPMFWVAGTWVLAAVVTNPLVGSRFLSGSFLVATGVAMLLGRSLLRLVPVASVLMLVLIFPSLDILRGDSTGSASVEVLGFSQAMLDYDFDAFEMGVREVSLSEDQREQLPPAWHLLLAPAARWIPIVARPFIGDSGGHHVAEATGMLYTNVSMPLWAEGHLIAGALGTGVALAALGVFLGTVERRKGYHLSAAQFASIPGSVALLFIVLRGSLYEVLGYIALAAGIYYLMSRSQGKGRDV